MTSFTESKRQPAKFPKAYYQRGMGMTGWLAIIIVVGIIAKFGIAIGPAMYENYMLRDAMKSIAELPNVKEISKSDIKKRLSSAFMVNNIRMIPNDAIQINRGPDRSWVVNVYWLSMEPFFADIYVTHLFMNRLDTAKPDECCSLEMAERDKLKSELLTLLKSSASDQAKSLDRS